MANTFKNALARNVGTSAVSVYTAPAGTTSICISLDVANVTGSTVTASVLITKSSLDYHVIRNVSIPTGNSAQVIAGQKIVLSDGDILKVVSNTASALDVVASILEDV